MVFAVIGFGYVLGRIPFGPVRLESVTGVLLAGLVFGHFGLGQEMFASKVGFIFFIYSVGFQAGPHFFSVFAQDGKRYVALVLFTAAAAVIATLVVSMFFGLSLPLSTGVLAGGLTSTPTLAAAQDAVTSRIGSARAWAGGFLSHRRDLGWLRRDISVRHGWAPPVGTAGAANAPH